MAASRSANACLGNPNHGLCAFVQTPCVQTPFVQTPCVQRLRRRAAGYRRRAIGDGLVEMAVEAELAVRRSRRLLPYLVILSPATDSAPQLAVYSAPSAHLPPSRFFSTSTDLSFSLDSFPCSKIEKKISEGPRSTRHRVTGRVHVVACYPTS